MTKKYAMFVGRWQPFHKGHEWLIDQKLAKGTPVLLFIRDVPPDERNPLTAEQVQRILQLRYSGSDVEVKVAIIPDIESLNWGRDVGYETNCHPPPPDVCAISATKVRASIAAGDESWRQFIDPSIQGMVRNYLAGAADEKVAVVRDVP